MVDEVQGDMIIGVWGVILGVCCLGLLLFRGERRDCRVGFRGFGAEVQGSGISV